MQNNSYGGRKGLEEKTSSRLDACEVREISVNEAQEIVRNYSEDDGKRPHLARLIKEYILNPPEELEKMHMADILDLARKVKSYAEEKTDCK